jgi:MFS family permease
MPKNKQIITAMIVWIFVTLFYCYQYVLRLLPNVIMPELMQQFSIGANEFGEFAGIYYIGYILMQIPFGILLSRFGGKIIMPISIITLALGILPISLSDNWQIVILGRFFIGVGASAAIVGAFQIFRAVFPAHFTLMLGSMVCIGLLTAVYISQPLSVVIHSLGISTAVNAIVISGIILAVVTYMILPKMPTSKTANIWTDIKEILFNGKLLLMSFLAGMMVAPLEGFADAWGTAFFRVIYGLERSTADSITATILTGMCIGSIALPFIAEKTKRYYLTTICSGIVMALCFIFILRGKSSTNLLYAVCLAIGIFSAYQVVIISRISTYVKVQLSGMAAAISNMIVMSFGYAFHKIIAYTIQHDAEVKVIDSVTTYGYNDYICGVMVIPIAIVVAVIGFIWAVLFKYRPKKQTEM